MSMCSDAGQALIEDDIKEKGVNRVIVGACAPSLHEQTFRGTVSRAGLNPYIYHHVGLREQDSWVHHSDHSAATEKAIRLMSAGLAKARLLSALEPIQLEAERHALVIGAGIAGISAAIHALNHNLKPVIIEKNRHLGGRVRSFYARDIGQTLDNGQHILATAYTETRELLANIGSLDKVFFQESFEARFIKNMINFAI